MSKLDEFYKLCDSIRKNFPDCVNEEQWRQQEDTLLQEELAAAVRQTIAAPLMGVQCPVTITVDYVPQGEIKVNVVRKGEAQKMDESDERPVTTRSESIGFTVRFPDGTTVQRKNAKETMIGTLKVIGLHRAAAFRGRLFKGYPLVSRKERTDVDFKCQELVDGWYVYTNMANETKIEVLRQISDELRLDLVITGENGRGVSDYSGGREQKRRAMYTLDGDGPHNKRYIVFMAVTRYVMEHPDSTLEQIETAFPKELQGSYGVVRPMRWIEDRARLGNDVMNRFYTASNDILTSSDGVRFAVSKEWGNNFANFVRQVEKLGWKVSEC